MARFTRLDVLNAMVEIGLVPVFYHPDLETAKKIVAACLSGALEWSNLPTAATLPIRYSHPSLNTWLRQHQRLSLGWLDRRCPHRGFIYRLRRQLRGRPGA